MLIAIVLLVVLTPMDARAQFVATSFDQLQPLLKQGDIVEITESGGQRVEGRVVDLLSSALEVRVLKPRPEGREPLVAQRRLLEDEVRQILLEHRDPLWNGTLIGLGAAALPGIVTIAYGLQAADEGYSTGAEVAGAGIIFLGIGAGVGALVDASIRQRTTVYFRPPTQRGSRLRLSPLLSPSASGFRVTMLF